MRSIQYFLTSLMGLVGLFVLTSSASYAAETIQWAGCGITKKAFMKELAKAYTKKQGLRLS